MDSAVRRGQAGIQGERERLEFEHGLQQKVSQPAGYLVSGACTTGLRPPDVSGQTMGKPTSKNSVREVYPVDVSSVISGCYSAMLLSQAAIFNQVYRAMGAIDDYCLDKLPDLGDSSHTRTHVVPFLKKKLYGSHLINEKAFDKEVGELSNPHIVVIKGPYINSELHTFILLKNSKKNEYCSFQVRHGNYFPEYMPQDSLSRYLREEKAEIEDVLCLNTLVSFYHEELDSGALRDTLREHMTQHWSFHPSQSNCLTFVLLALRSANLDVDGMMSQAGLSQYHSPARLMVALKDQSCNKKAFYGEGGDIHLPEMLRGCSMNERKDERKTASFSDVLRGYY